MKTNHSFKTLKLDLQLTLNASMILIKGRFQNSSILAICHKGPKVEVLLTVTY